MTKGVFITGTDTGVGKTRFTLGLMHALKKNGVNVSGMKPIASGAEWVNGALINEDAHLIRNSCNNVPPYELVNPVVFEPPVAPHVAARQAGMTIDIKQIADSYEALASQSEFVVVEGIGGWRVPVSGNATLTDLVQTLGIPVILIVGLRLGCISHALLTAEVIIADGVKLSAWAGNLLDKDYLYKQETINTLKQRLTCAHIMDMDYLVDFSPDNLIGQKHIKSILEQLDM
ncbi:MAG: dethiobiotin synthase [Proteobacteria bacterium]|nr:dethiobiotin synthase [Pseudomonadota bacterium]